MQSGDLLIADADGVFVLKLDVAHAYLEQFQLIEREEKTKKDNFFLHERIDEYYF